MVRKKFVLRDPYGQDRSDLMGIELRNAFLPCGVFARRSADGDGFIGVLPDMVSVLERDLNFTAAYVIPADRSYGARLPDGSFGGIVGMVQRGEADFTGACLSMTVDRSEAVDFSAVTHSTKTSVFLRRTGRVAVSFTTYWDVFLRGAWAVVAAGVGLLCLSLYLIVASLSPAGRRGSPRGAADSNLVWTCGEVGLFLLQKSDLDSGRLASLKVYLLAASAFSVVVFSYYNAMLTSNMIDLPSEPALRSMADLIAADVRLVAVANTSSHFHLRSMPGWLPEAAGYIARMEADPSRLLPDIGTALEDFDRVSAGDPDVALFGSRAAFGSRVRDFIFLPRFQQAYSDPWAYGLRRDSEFREAFNAGLVRMDQSGIKDKLLGTAGGQSSSTARAAPDGSGEGKALGYNNVVVVFAALVSGAAVAVAIMAAEVVVQRLPKRTSSEPAC